MITDPHTEKIRVENDELKRKLEELEAKLAAVPKAKQEWVGELPRYKLIKPFYGPDDVLYDPEEPGFEAIDYTGVPNEHMEPMNEPAKKRMEAWLESLPGKGRAPELGDISEAAVMLRARWGDVEIPAPEFHASVAKLAKEIMHKRLGTPVDKQTVELPHKIDNIPIMGNEERARKRAARADMLKAVTVDPKTQQKQTRVIMPNANVDNSTATP